MYLEVGNYTISVYVFIPILLIILGIFFYIFFLLFLKFFNKNGGADAVFKMQLLRIRVPKFKSEKDSQEDLKNQDLQENISVIENLYSILGGLKAQRGFKAKLQRRDDHFSFEIVLDKGMINFYIGVPKSKINFFKERIQAVYVDAEIELIKDYNIFTPNGKISGACFDFKKSFVYPIKTYKNLKVDPLGSLLNSLSKIEKGDSAAIQIVARSANKKWYIKSSLFTKSISDGKKISEAQNIAGLAGFWGAVSLAVGNLSEFTKTKKENGQPEIDKKETLSQMEQEMVKNIEEKNSKAGFDINIRIVVNAQNHGLAETYLDDIVNSFSQYNLYQYGNSLQIKKQNSEYLINDFIYRNFNEKYSMLMSTEELASIYHLPLPSTQAPTVIG
ncbi:hypothetical protein K8R66_03165 [bacterium]|nr:hypothetical protein [bacterium]